MIYRVETAHRRCTPSRNFSFPFFRSETIIIIIIIIVETEPTDNSVAVVLSFRYRVDGERHKKSNGITWRR